MRRFILLYVFIIVALLNARAQERDIKSIAGEFMSGSETVFSCSIVGEEGEKFSFEASGTAKLLGSCYNIVTDDGIVLISDGKSLWIINKDTDEAVVSSVDDTQAAPYDFTNPFLLLDNPQGNLKFAFKGTASGGNSKIPAEIRITGFKDDRPKSVLINIKKFSKRSLNSSCFVFNKSDYPGIELTDLR